MAEPAREEAAQQRPDGERGREHADRDGSAADDDRAHHREEHAGLPEGHVDEVGDDVAGVDAAGLSAVDFAPARASLR